MMRKISEMRGLGPAMERMLAEVEVCCEKDLKELGAVEAYARLKFRFGKHINIMALYGMHTAMEDRDWQDITTEEKERLKAAYQQRSDSAGQ